MTRYCPNCGSPLTDEQAFCGDCGTPAPSVPAPSQETVKMPAVAAGQPEADAAAEEPQYSAPTGPIFNTGVANKASGMAIAALVLGILSILSGPFIIGVVFGIVAIVLYAVSKKKHGKSGIGLAGMITGIVGSVISVITIVLAVLIIAVGPAGDVDADNPYPASQITEGNVMGEWYLDACYFPQSGDESYDESVFTYDEAVDLQMGGYGTTLTMEEDGTFFLESGGGEEYTGTWDLGDYYVVLDFDDRDADVFGYFYETDEMDVDYDELKIVDSSFFMEFER